ncbi:MAG TPA: AEC family transporter [Candidatus Copromonas faecavium]|uniref:AEC family transporter n=1 Tax=Candidatus Copromonas faecavium (nom. illeg.) TaxID=2840740 RepID=A0A9D1D688_9FIRM|nr:AEC family transporter [Candidatus Copromonas faecavium]
MDSLLVALNAVIPFLCYISFGYIVKVKGVVKENFLQQLNQMVFRLFYPCMTFYNIYKADADSLPRPLLLIFVGGSIILLEILLVLIVPRIIPENPKRGVIIQGVFRSNFVLFGLPLTVSVFGDSAASVAAMVVTVVVTIYNTTSVVILEMFNTSGKLNIKNVALNVIKNPLLQGAITGLVLFLLQIHLPECIVTPIAAFADMTSPLALFILGGTLHFNEIGHNLKYLVPTLSFKLAVLPAIMLVIGHALGLRGLELFLLIAVYGTPVAAASYPMAQNMGGDGELAGQLVVISTVVSVVTLFFWIFFLRSIGII